MEQDLNLYRVQLFPAERKVRGAGDRWSVSSLKEKK